MGYVDLGTTSTTTSNIFGFGSKQQVTGVFLEGVGSFPVNDQFSLLGKLGLIRWDSTETQCLVTSPFSDLACDFFADDGTDFVFGVGASYLVASNVKLRGEFERYGIDKEKAGAGDFNVLSLNLNLLF